MTLQTSGPISIGNIGTEFGIPTPTSMAQLYQNGSYILRNSTNIPTAGTISIGQFYGAVKGFLYNVSIGTSSNYSLRAAAIAAGWNQTSPLVANITITGVLGSSSTSTPAFTDDGSYPSGSSYIMTVNGGCYIVGKGGAGGNGGVWGYQGDTTGKAGGPAMYLTGSGITKTFVNNGVIGGGGGGGAGGFGCSWGSGYGGRYGGAGGGGAGSQGGAGGNPGAGPNAGNGSYPGGSTAEGGVGSVTSGGGGSGAWVCGNAGASGGNLGTGGGTTGVGGGVAGIGSNGWGSVSAYSGSGVTYGSFG